MNDRFEIIGEALLFAPSSTHLHRLGRSHDECRCDEVNSDDCVSSGDCSYPTLPHPHAERSMATSHFGQSYYECRDCECDMCDPADCSSSGGCRSSTLVKDVGFSPRWAESDCQCQCADCVGSGDCSGHLEKVIGSDSREPYRLSSGLIPIELSRHHYVIANPNAHQSVVVLSRTAYEYLMSFHESRAIPTGCSSRFRNSMEFIKSGLLVPTGGSVGLPKRPLPGTLDCWLHITNECTLACKYCYIHKSPGKMSPAVGQRAIETIVEEARSGGFQRVKIKYSGGEPTLNLDLVRELSTYARRKLQEFSIDLDEVILTNGVIPINTMDEIVNMGIRVMLSLDALGDEQDSQRPSITGKPVRQMTLDTLHYMKARGVGISVSVTVARQSAAVLIDLIDLLVELDVPFSINYARDNQFFDDRAGFAPQATVLAKTMREVIEHLAQNPPKRSLLNALMDRASLGAPHEYTCGAGRNYLVIDHLGRVSFCQQEMHIPISSVFEPAPLSKVAARRSGSRSISVDEKVACHKCKWRYWCTGGCPALTYQAYGRVDAQSPFCDVYKALFPEVIRLEGLRLLKYGRPVVKESISVAH